MSRNKPEPTAPFAYEGLDRVIHERARLSVLTSLITHPNGLSFVELKQLCGLTDGNLARHLQVLEEDRMVHVRKEAEGGRAQTGNRSQTVVRLTTTGRKRFLEYLATLETVIRDAASFAGSTGDAPLLGALLPLKA